MSLPEAKTPLQDTADPMKVLLHLHARWIGLSILVGYNLYITLTRRSLEAPCRVFLYRCCVIVIHGLRVMKMLHSLSPIHLSLQKSDHHVGPLNFYMS